METTDSWEAMMQAEDQRGASKDRRLLLRKDEAAGILSMSIESLERYVLPDIRTVRCGRLRLVPAAELCAWVDLKAVGTGV